MDKEHEHEADREERGNKLFGKTMFGMGAFLIICFCVILGSGFFQDNPGFKFGSEQIQVAKSAGEMRGSNYSIIVDELKAKGFTSIDAQPMNDMGGA